MEATLGYVAAAAVALWGVAHAIPTRSVVAGFAPISPDNRRVLLQEWLAEAFAMWGISAVIVATTATVGAEGSVWVYRVTAGLLISLAVLTVMTGARTPGIWFKLCPILLTGSAAMLLAASWL
jgi:hypothetical protein